MNEIITHTSQLPDTIEDLTQFVLVGKSKLNAYLLKLRTVNRLSIAQEIRNQTLEETQELANALIAAEQRIGELLLAIPKATPNNNPFHENPGDGNLVKSKSETIKEMGYGKNEAADYQQMAKNPEIVRKVIEEATANGEVVTKAAVMREIQQARAEAREEARQEAHATIEQLRRDNRTLANRAAGKTMVVAPEDYEQTKKQVEMLEADNERLSKERKEALRELRDAKNTLDAVAKPGDVVIDKAKEDFDNFAIATYNYIRRYGGFVWGFDKWADIPNETKRNFEKAVQALSAFSQQMVDNVGGLQ